MIEQIHIDSVACYDNVTINNLKKINFIYGANGVGKTTISNIIQSPDKYPNCKIDWLGNSPISTLVYNKNFREQNFGESKIPGVFTLGSATKENVEEIERMKTKFGVHSEEIIQKRKTIESQKGKLDQFNIEFANYVWESIKRKYEEIFKDAFQGFSNSKSKFSQKVLREWENKGKSTTTLEDIKERSNTLFGDIPNILNPIKNIDSSKIVDIELNTIWDKKILGKNDIGIASLIQHLNSSDWVNQGRKYIQENSDICPFCQQRTINNDFKKNLEEYFDETYISDIDLVTNLSNEYVSKCNNLIENIQNIIEEEKNNPNTKLNVEFLRTELEILNQIFVANTEILKSKKLEPSKSLNLKSTKENIEKIQQTIKQSNLEIENHNILVVNFEAEKEKLIDDIWKYIINENILYLKDYIRKRDGLNKGIKNLENRVNQLDEENGILKLNIAEANKKVTSIQSSVDEINKTLTAYGFTNFKIVPDENNYYQIQRENGEKANNTLSEGEVTFITFLYFMQLVKGGTSPENANENKVIIIDDPISSLDSTILFVVSSLIKEEIKNIKKGEGNIKQIIVLTHNIYFHKEVSFIDGRTYCDNDRYFWIVRKNNNKSSIQCYEKNNPIKGSYELLWDELKNAEGLSIITIQNTMRRIYETYFKILGKYNDDGILGKIEDVQEKEICRSLLCWINDGSHCVPDDLHIVQDDEIIVHYKDVFKKIFEIMGHIEHYNMMMGIS